MQCGAVLKAWRANGLQIDGKRGVTEGESLALFGMPLSGLMTETLSDGKQYQVQWFERARFELHPENVAPYDVLLGLLGSEVGVPPGTKPFVVVQPTPVRVGPGASYPQFPKIALTFTGLQDKGYTPGSTKTEWQITQTYAQGLDDGTAVIVDPATKRIGLVQFYIRSESFLSPAGNMWGISYGVAQFSSLRYAELYFASTDITFPGSDLPTSFELDYGCKEKFLTGIDANRLTHINTLYICGNSVINMQILGSSGVVVNYSADRWEAGDMISDTNTKIWMYEHFVWALRN